MIKGFFIAYLVIAILVTLAALVILFRRGGVYGRFVGILVMCTNVILILVLIGFIDGRRDMYVDISISYAILGFISSVIVAKFLGTSEKSKTESWKEKEEHGN
ncbi:MAG: pH regulation protein F [Firmicutes bacterium]|jgi:multicomponent Na+:H+ antiporter subunit F|nr:pH regulation protein F [Bacillota bacterium]